MERIIGRRPAVGDWWTLWCLLLAVPLASLVVISSDSARVALAALLPLGLMWALRRHLAFGLASPVAVVVFVLIVMALSGYFFYEKTQDAAEGGSIRIVLTPAQRSQTVYLMLVAATVLSFGVAVLTILVKPPAQVRLGVVAAPSPTTRRLLLAFAPVPLFLTVAGDGPAALLHRQMYIEPHSVVGKYLSSAGTAGGAVAVMVLGYLYSTTKKRRHRPLLLGVAAMYGVVAFAQGSRKMAVLPLLFVVAVLVSTERRGGKVWAAFIAGTIISIELLHLALFLRGLPEHGIIPYVQGVESGYLDSGVGYDAVGRNILIAFALIGATAYQAPPIPHGDLFVSVNPIPGGSAGWYDIAFQHRFNSFTPYAGLGELANDGISTLVIYFIIAGLVLAVFDRECGRLVASGRNILAIGYLGLAGYFALTMMQYNLRSGTRYLYYGLVATAVLRIVVNRSRAPLPGENTQPGRRKPTGMASQHLRHPPRTAGRTLLYPMRDDPGGVQNASARVQEFP